MPSGDSTQTNQSSSLPADPSLQNDGDQQTGESKPTRPEGLGDAYWDDAKGVQFDPLLAELNRLTAFEAATSAERAQVPEKPEAYQLQVDTDFKVPDGLTFTPDDKHPLVEPLRAWAHEAGLSQAEFSKLYGKLAAYELAQQAEVSAGKAAEVNKLGTNSAARITEAGKFLTALNGGKPSKLFAEIATADALEEVENIMRAVSTQGSGTYRNGGREPPSPPPKSFAQKLYPNQPSAAVVRSA